MADLEGEGNQVFPVIYLDEENASMDMGISKRDWFAAMAMQGMVVGSKDSTESMHPTTALEVARAAYHYADIMIRVSQEPSTLSHPDG